ncbi:hypothetical protein LUZ60_005419 [Juncus effusus]|nr:hypothetical protein LUZ60_005419 [Juncus effusus]
MASSLLLPPTTSPPKPKTFTKAQPWIPSPSLLSLHPSLYPFLSCTSLSHLHQIHALTIKTNSFEDNHVASRLISFAALHPTESSLSYALSIFSQVENPDVYMINTLLTAHSISSDPFETIRFYTRVLSSYLVADFPDKHSFVKILKVCSAEKLISFGKMIHAQVSKLGYGKDAFVVNFLVDFYASCGFVEMARCAFNGISDRNDASVNMMLNGYVKNGRFEQARKMFDEKPERSVFEWSVMINGYVQSSHYKEALELFNTMIKSENKIPNESILVNILSSCAHLSALEQGKKVENYMKSNNIYITVRIGTTLVDMYLKCGLVEKAFEIFHSLEEKNVFTWSAMIGGLATNGQAKNALNLFSEMLQNNIRPNEASFVGVLNACSHTGLDKEGQKYFDSMQKDYGIKPNMHHYCCMVDMYGRARNIQKAEDIIAKMPFKPNEAVLGALLNSCKLHGDLDLAERIGKKLIELDPNNSGRYVLLSNIYASENRFDDVAKIRKLMREKNVSKKRGVSFVEINGKIHEFLAGDVSHPNKLEIYEKLEEMSRNLINEGYKPKIDEVLIEMEEEKKPNALFHHSERLALAFGLISTDSDAVIRIRKNLRVCKDCHEVFKLVSRVYGRRVFMRDRCRFHHFKDGYCSCMDYW